MAVRCLMMRARPPRQASRRARIDDLRDRLAAQPEQAFARARELDGRLLVRAHVVDRMGLEVIERVIEGIDAREGAARAGAAVELGGHLLPIAEVEPHRRIEAGWRIVEPWWAKVVRALAGFERRDEAAADGEVGGGDPQSLVVALGFGIGD